MIRINLCILIALLPLPLIGQLLPLSDQYGYDALAINPAFAGCHDALSVTLSYRDQWVGFKDAPKTYLLSLHTPTDKDRMGLGILLENQTIGIYGETHILGNYAYRRELYNGKLALGLGFGATIYNVKWDELNANDAGDAELMNNPTSAVLPAFSLGSYYYTNKYYIGFSLPLFLSNETDGTSGRYKIKNRFSDYNYYLTGGREFDVGNGFKILPSMLLKYHPKQIAQVDFNLQMILKDKISTEIGYRTGNMLIAMLQCQVNYQLCLAYSYDFNFGNLNKYANGSHEIMLSYIFRYERNVVEPRQF